MIGFLFRTLKLGVKIGIVVAGIAIVISYARLSEFGDMRKELMDKLADSYAGRLKIDGKAELQMTFPPSVSIDGVRLKNSKWGTRPDMMTVKRVVAEIDLLPLLRGDMAVPRLRMIGVDIIVERKKDGTTNWDELNEFDTAAGPATPAMFPVIFPQIAGATVTVAGGTLTVVGTGTPTTVSLSGADIEVADGGAGSGSGGSGGDGVKPCP